MRVVFAVHNHQPIGNLDGVFERATEQAYLPFLEALEGSPPATKVVVHNSGPLWEWWLERMPDVAERFASSERIEFLAGGWYEPVLAAIPENDRVEQLRLATTRLTELTGTTPRGVWLGERVWEPSLAGTLNRHHFGYTILDGENLPDHRSPFRPYTVDYHGRTLAIFFIDQQLRHAVPGSPVAEVIAMLERYDAADPDGVAVFGDDGEKFGLWGNGHSADWLIEFFQAVQDHPRLELTTMADAFERVGSGGGLALGPATYSEMMEWSGGYWPALVYARLESKILFRRMIRLSRQLRRAGEDARLHLLRAQCNDAYWHGAFGGSHLPFLRRAVSAELIEARIAHDRRSSGWIETEMLDWSADGVLDLCVEMPQQSWVVSTRRGALYYFDDKPTVWPLTDLAWPDEAPMALEDRWEDGRIVTYRMVDPVTGRGDISIAFVSDTVTKTLAAVGRSIEVGYRLEGAAPGRFGPLLPLALGPEATIRIDGGPPMTLAEPFERDGHRFRIEADRDRQVLVSLPIPGRVSGQPITTEYQDESGAVATTFQGVLLWLTYPSDVTGTYRFKIEVKG